MRVDFFVGFDGVSAPAIALQALPGFLYLSVPPVATAYHVAFARAIPGPNGPIKYFHVQMDVADVQTVLTAFNAMPDYLGAVWNIGDDPTRPLGTSGSPLPF